jgi:hypothetical protein
MTPTNRILAYGRPGIGKSTLIAMLIAYMFMTYGLKTRVVGGDGGGSKAFEALVAKGMAEFWDLSQWNDQSIFHYIEFAGRGYWPADVKKIGSELIAPRNLFRVCPKCKGKFPGTMPKSCPLCKEVFGAGVRLPVQEEPVESMKEIGAYAFDGLSFYGQAMMDALKAGNPAGGNSINIDGYTVANSGQSHYGLAQGYLASMIDNFKKIPVKVVLATALEKRGVSEGGGGENAGTPLYGPSLPGKALTDIAAGWFTDAFHLEGEESKGSDGLALVKRVIYFTKHFPKDTSPYGFVAKTSAPIGGGMPDFMEMKAGENFFKLYFEKLEKAYEKSVEGLLK